MSLRRLGALVVTVSLISSCSGGGSSDAIPPAERVAATSGLVAETHGFPFANFGASNSPEVMDGEDLRLMFGDGVCENGKSTPCAPTSEAAAWAQMVNQSRQAGHCEGMVVQAINRYTTSASPLTSALTNEADTTHGIIRAFATQFFPKVRKESNKWAKKSIGEILSTLQESFTSKKLTYTMGLYSDMGGHAVLPLSIEYPTNTTAKVHLYDTNWPGQDRYVEFDLEKNTWRFSFSGNNPATDSSAWTGGKGDIDLSSMESRMTTDAPFDTGSNGVLGNFLVIRSASLDWTIETANGVVSPSSTSDNTATIQPLKSATTKTIPEFVVYTESTKLSLSLPKESSVYAVGNNKIVSVITNGSSTPIEITEDSVSVPSTAEASVASDNLAATVRGGDATIERTETALVVTGDEITTPVTVNETKPQITVVIKNNKFSTTIGSSITKPFPALPTSLVPADTKPGLPPQDVRALTVTSANESTTTVTPTTVVASSTSTTVKTTTTTTISTATVPTTTTTISPNAPVALQYQGSTQTWIRNQSIPTMNFRFINASNQWASTASGTCTVTLLPELDNGSLNGAQLTGTLSTTATGNGTCSFSGVIISGTQGVKYRLRFAVQGTNATTTLGPQTLY